MDNHAYVETLSHYVELPINNVTMKFVIVVYGNVINSKTEESYFAPCIIPKTCDQVRGIIVRHCFLVVSQATSKLPEQHLHISK